MSVDRHGIKNPVEDVDLVFFPEDVEKDSRARVMTVRRSPIETSGVHLSLFYTV